jgi:two-component system nitrate/nitrite response regulator NarL
VAPSGQQSVAEIAAARQGGDLPGRRGRDRSMIDLTQREHDVLRLVVKGLSNKLIADELDIADHTAKFHVLNAIKKLRAGNRTRAAVIYDRMQRDSTSRTIEM